jgi:glycine oxidase
MSVRHTTDVVIIGGGVIGCSIAYYLRKAGVGVTIVEREEIAAEASSAAAGLLAPWGGLSGPGAFADLLLANWSLHYDLIPVLEEASGVKAEFSRPGSLSTVSRAEDVPDLRRRATIWEEMGLQVTWLTGDEARQHEPLLSPDVLAAVYSSRDGSIMPGAMTRAYAGAARRLGAVFYERSEVTGLERNASRVTGVETAMGEVIGCQHLVIAAGAWSARCGEWLGFNLPISPERGQILSLWQPTTPLQHILIGEGIYIGPKLDGTVYVGATIERIGFDKRVTVGGIAWLLASAMRLVPAFEHANIAHIWAGLRPGSPDRRPILGKAPGWENVTLATGHSGMGFELSAITGKTIAELVTTGQTPDLIRAFGLERFMQ